MRALQVSSKRKGKTFIHLRYDRDTGIKTSTELIIILYTVGSVVRRVGVKVIVGYHLSHKAFMLGGRLKISRESFQNKHLERDCISCQI